MFESWYISAWKEDGIQNESRETDGYDVISKAFYDGQELLFVLAVHLKHPNSTIRGWPQITKQIATKFYEPVSMSLDETVSSSRSYDCSAAEELADLPEFYSFLDRDELMKARKELDEGCNRITSFIPELISCILTVVIIVATIIILKWYHKKERRAKTELQEGNPLQANQQSTNCIIL
ncbi:unnamed protein product [Oikopleura dioica]|uniref:Uncharacterized protein n=1 Tax=Oikopleura dioica TaxID=34765 RepID=E4Y1K3_OIKDI|nr:unnamed protein product [Oikopleura dioica]